MIFHTPLTADTLLTNVRYLWIANGTAGLAQTTGITQPDPTFPVFRIDAVPPASAEQLVVYDNTDTSNWNDGGYTLQALISVLVLPALMVLTVPLQTGTTLANVRYKWIVAGVIGSALSTGVTQPSLTYPTFRLSLVPPTGAEEVIVYDSTDTTNWNVGSFASALQAGASSPTGGNISANLSSLRVIAAAYLRIEPSAFIIGGVDLFIVSANSIRRNAELLHDFNSCRCTATLTINGNAGADFADAVMVPDTFQSLKSIIGISRARSNGEFITVDFTNPGVALERDRYSSELQDGYDYSQRYLSDADVLRIRSDSTVIQRGNKLFVYPSFATDVTDNQVPLTVEGYGWLNDYGADDPVDGPEDFIVQYGFDYLKWAIICDLNNIFQTFVPRQEGNLAPPEKDRDAAFQKLILFDSYQVDGAVTRSR